ncbi:MAG: Na(+)-translocating NADH-quinone reductase subunit A [Bacteroidetes bacterium]|nr:Na(+)-translocating NADH-quinone reductase subunit A [Bacteroidota bacterium]HET6245962.1 Na(+)-translocating NADH-quinone reductase subunit A [Bacteroidia bacterium]
MSKHIKIKQGLNIKLKGEAEKLYSTAPYPEVFAIKPTDFTGVTPKLLVKQGDVVKAGSPLFYDKYNEAMQFCAPISGEIIEIVRGEKRKILEVKILADKEIAYKEFKIADPSSLTREEIIGILLESGTWPFIRQRPYHVIANPTQVPKAIFISAFDTSPLAPDNDFIIHNNAEAFQTGLNAIAKLTEGKVHLNVSADLMPSKVFTNSKGVQVNKISGPHPAGNVGVQIHHIDPVNKGEVVWYLYPQDVLIIGKLFNLGKLDATRVVALAGSQVKNPRYFKTIVGSSLKNILSGNLIEDKNRIISGNVFTGTQVLPDGFLGFYDTLISVIPEGDEPQFLGWLIPGSEKFSFSRTFTSWLRPGKEYVLNTNLNGEERPFVVTGEYEKVFPFNIYPMLLLKAILVEDVELMEKLGIYEVAEEDFALCEFICPSKIDSQKIIRKGLDTIKKEFS